MGKWREGEKWRFTRSPCLLFLAIESPFSHSPAIFSLLSISSFSLSPFSHHFSSLVSHSLTIFSLLSISSFSLSPFSHHFSSLVSHSLTIFSFSPLFPFPYILFIFSFPRHFLSLSTCPYFLSRLWMPNCLNKDAF